MLSSGEVKGEPAARSTMRTEQKRILCRNKLQDKYSRHPSRALSTALKQLILYLSQQKQHLNDSYFRAG